MVVDAKPIGRELIVRVELTNPESTEFPVEARMYRGTISEDGELELTPADEDFLVFPAQIVVPGQSQQSFRVQYVGEPEIDSSQIYYLQLRQVPVEFAPGQSQVQVTVNFNILVNVVPDGVTPAPAVQSATATEKNGAPGVEIRLTNTGTRYYTASSMAWKLQGTAEDGSPFVLDMGPRDVAKLIGVGVVAPGRDRVFFVPTEKPLAGPVQVTLGG